MEAEQKSSPTSQKTEVKEKKMNLVEALDSFGVKDTKRFAAIKKFKGVEEMIEKEWRKLFFAERILEK